MVLLASGWYLVEETTQDRERGETGPGHSPTCLRGSHQEGGRSQEGPEGQRQPGCPGQDSRWPVSSRVLSLRKPLAAEPVKQLGPHESLWGSRCPGATAVEVRGQAGGGGGGAEAKGSRLSSRGEEASEEAQEPRKQVRLREPRRLWNKRGARGMFLTEKN